MKGNSQVKSVSKYVNAETVYGLETKVCDCERDENKVTVKVKLTKQ